MRFLSLFVCLIFLLSSCQKEDNAEQLDIRLEAQIKQYSEAGSLEGLKFPSKLSDIPQDPNNPLTPEKVNLGKLLFHESIIATKAIKSENKFTYSCASCHHAQAGFQACLPQGIGEGGLGFGIVGESRVADLNKYSAEELDVQPVRTPTVLNVAFQDVMLWNGQFGATGTNEGTESSWTSGTPKDVNHLGFEGVETQAIAGLKVHRLEINEEFVNEYPEYKALFDDAFNDLNPSDRYTNITAGLAIAAYERTILSTEAPFQKWLNGNNDAMSDQEKEGAILFFGKAKCFNCHDGPALNSTSFHALGMNDLNLPGVYNHGLDDNTARGRGGFTGNRADDYKFKVPQLYSIRYSPFYGHGSSFNTVRDVITYKNKAIAQNEIVPEHALDDQFEPLGLTNNEIMQLEAFIVNALDDKNLARFVPNELPSGLCFPNNDDPSRKDLGCE